MTYIDPKTGEQVVDEPKKEENKKEEKKK